jgi:LemA protein
MALIVVGLLTVLVAAWVVVTYNRLVSLRLACASSWSQIDVALKLRHDLVPPLAASVAGYAGHERTTLEEVTRKRAAAVAVEGAGPDSQAPAEGALAGSLGRMLLLAESYPELRASENFATLQRDLAEVEEKIAITRRVYNDTVETYNTRIGIFPPLVVAKLFRFGPRQFFEAPLASRFAPAVSLAPGGASG